MKIYGESLGYLLHLLFWRICYDVQGVISYLRVCLLDRKLRIWMDRMKVAVIYLSYHENVPKGCSTHVIRSVQNLNFLLLRLNEFPQLCVGSRLGTAWRLSCKHLCLCWKSYTHALSTYGSWACNAITERHKLQVMAVWRWNWPSATRTG